MRGDYAPLLLSTGLFLCKRLVRIGPVPSITGDILPITIWIGE
jgi:hypothetical protein